MQNKKFMGFFPLLLPGYAKQGTGIFLLCQKRSLVPSVILNITTE